MEATATVNRVDSTRNGFATVSEAATYLSVSSQTIRNLTDSLQLEGFVTSGSHRRISWSSLKRFAGYDTTSCDSASASQFKAIAYVRCSTQEQATTGSQTRQLNRVLAEVCQREGCNASEVAIYQDTKSAFSSRDGLNRMVSHIMDGVVSGRLYVEYQDRLARDSVIHLVEFICQKCGIEIVYLDSIEKDPNELSAAFSEAMAFLNIIVNRINGQKASKVVSKRLDKATIDRALELRRSGIPNRKLVAILNAEGHTSKRIDGTSHPITYDGICKIFSRNKTLSKVLLNGEPKIADWAAENLVEVNGGVRLACKEVYDAFRKYCRNLGHNVTCPNHTLGRDLPFDRVQSNSRWYFVGVAFKSADIVTCKLDTSDSIGAFLERWTVRDDSSYVKVRTVLKAYREFCKDNGMNAEVTTLLSRRLRKLATRVASHGGSYAFYGLRFIG